MDIIKNSKREQGKKEMEDKERKKGEKRKPERQIKVKTEARKQKE